MDEEVKAAVLALIKKEEKELTGEVKEHIDQLLIEK